MRSEERNVSDPFDFLDVQLFDAPAAPGTTEVVRYESRRWRYGDSTVVATNDSVWRNAA